MNLKYEYLRADWEEPKMTVAGHTTSGPFPWRTVDKIAIHYTAAKRVGRDTAQYLRQIQSSYVRNRGYSIGYSAAVDQSGKTWELRGTRWMCAANKNRNPETFAVLLLVDSDDPANDAMIAATRALIQQFRDVSPNDVTIVGHKDIGATACPGNGLTAQLRNGVFEPIISVVDIVDLESGMKISGVPSRVYDSRGDKQWRAGETRAVQIGSGSAVFVNVTATGGLKPGFVTVWGDGPQPNVSNLNFGAGQDICNTSWVPVKADGTINVCASEPVHLIFDVQASV